MTLNKIRRVVAFLLLGVGIVYIVLFIQAYFSTISEGFQVGTSCQLTSIGGRNTYLCPDDNSAYLLVALGTTTPVCYTDRNINYSTIYDSGTGQNIKFSTAIGSVGYTCYDINGEPQFDSTRGVYLPFNPIIDNDSMPNNGINDYNIGANTFISGYNSFGSAYKNTDDLRSTVSTLGLVNIKSVQSRLQTLSTGYCATGLTIHTNANACGAITSALNTTGSIINDNSDTSLSFINSTLYKSASTIKYNFYNKFMQSFYTNPTVFISSPRVAEYMGNK